MPLPQEKDSSTTMTGSPAWSRHSSLHVRPSPKSASQATSTKTGPPAMSFTSYRRGALPTSREAPTHLPEAVRMPSIGPAPPVSFRAIDSPVRALVIRMRCGVCSTFRSVVVRPAASVKR